MQFKSLGVPNKHFAMQKVFLYRRKHCLRVLWSLSRCFPNLKIILQSRPSIFKFHLMRAVIFFFAQEVFEFAIAASRASWYRLAIFESDFSNPASKHLLAFAQTRYSAQNCAGYTFPLIPNKQIFLEKNLFYENQRWFIQYYIKPELSLPVLKVKSGSIPSGFYLGFS